MKIGMSTSCVYPWSTERAFAMAKLAGFDGVEIMVSSDAVTRDAARLRALSEEYALPILSIHAPVLLLTQFVWGTDPAVKLRRSAELAAEVGATTVVVHPPFRWQGKSAKNFLDVVRSTTADSGVEIAVENMFPWLVRGRLVDAYAPGWDPRQLDADAVTLDFSHAALAGVDGLEVATELGDRLRHIHLCDGSGSVHDGRIFDEHLFPGEGTQPVPETLGMLAAAGWNGSIVAEVNTRKAREEADRLELLRRVVDFTRAAIAAPAHPSPSAR